jgi:sugar transferase EpsL
MNDKMDDDVNLLPDAFGLIKTGAFVHKIALDEFPQLLNVLIGEMSLIDIRPLLRGYLSLHNETQKRHEVGRK